MGSFEDYYASLQKSVSGGSVAQKDDDFNKYYDSLKMDIGSIPDTRPKQSVKTKQVSNQEDSIDSIRSSQRQVEKTATFTPKPFSEDPMSSYPLPPKPVWNGVLDNPITKTAGKTLNAVGKGIDKVEEVTGLKNIQGAVRGLSTADMPTHKSDGTYLGEYKALGQNAVEGVGNLLKGAKEGLLHPDQATKKFDDTVDKGLKNAGPVTKFAGKMIADAGTDPLTFVPIPSIRGIKGAISKVSGALEKAPVLPSYEGLGLTSKLSGKPSVAIPDYVSNFNKNATQGYKVGDHAIPTSADGADLSEAKKIIDVQHKDGVNYYRFDGENTYMPEHMVRKADEAPTQPINEFAKANQESAATQSGPLGTRANFKNQMDNGNFSDGMKQKINSTDQTYEKVTNQGSVDAANEAVKNLPKAESDFLLNEKGGPDHIATGYRLMQKLDALGEHERALIVSKKLAQDLTAGGQTVQAASILSRLSPEGQLLNLVRTAEKNGMEVKVADSVKFKELAAKVQEKSGAGVRANQYNEILNRMEKGENISVDDVKKLSDYLAGAKKDIKSKTANVIDEIPPEFKDVRKRDKVVSFLDNAEQAALARIAARKNNLNSLPLAEWGDHAIVVSSQIAKGTIKAATHVEDLVKMFGEEIRPVATQVFQKAQGMLKSVSRTTAEGNFEKASQALRRVSGEAEQEKAIVVETANHVKKLIADAKAGKLNPHDIQKLRDYSDEIADMIKDKETKIPTQDEKFLQTVKSLAKKIAQVETEKMPSNIANREVSDLLRQITKLAEDGKVIAKEPIDNQALSDIAHDVLEKSRPTPKPTTLQEKLVEKYIKANPTVTQKDIASLRQLAKDVTRLSTDEGINADIAMQKILNSYEKSSPWDKVQAVRYMSMLLNTSTQAVNAISGPVMATTGHVADVFGTMIDIAMSKALNKPRTVTLYGTNPLKFMARYFKNAKVGGRAGWEGADPAGIHSTAEIRGLAYKSLKNPLGLAERSLGAVAKGADYATYKSVYQSEIEKQGFLDAKNKGIKGKSNIQKHIEAFVNEPSEEAMLIADRIGKNTTFQRSDSLGGKTANFINSAPGPIKPFTSAIVPFVRTPVNIASSAVTMTPAGIIKGLYQLSSKSQATQREAIRTLSLGITGSGIGALGFYLSQLGIVTGANDSGDKNVDAIKEQAGKGKYRFNTSALYRYLEATFNGEGEAAAEKAAQYQEGDKQFDYNKLQPLALPFAIGASLGNSKNKSIGGKLASAGSDAYGSLFGMSTLKGVQDIFQPSYGGSQGEKALGVPSRIAESFLKSFSPSFLGQEARRQDPIVRKTPFNDGIQADVKGYFQSRTPGLSQSLPASKTTLGQDKLNAPGIKGQYLNPFKSDVAPYNRAAVLISDLIDITGDTSLAPSAPEKNAKGKDRQGKDVTIPIPQKRYEEMQKVVGDEIISKILSMDTNLTDQKKADKIHKIYEDARAREMNKVKRELGIRVH